MSARYVALHAVLLIGALAAPWALQAAGSVAPSLTEADVKVLRRVGELGIWLQRPIALECAVCVQERMGTRWPASGLAALDESRESAARIAVEQCETQHAGGADGTRIVPQATAALRERLLRLAGPRLVLASCAASGDVQRFRQCVESRLGRPVTEDEGRMLLAALGTSR